MAGPVQQDIAFAGVWGAPPTSASPVATPWRYGGAPLNLTTVAPYPVPWRQHPGYPVATQAGTIVAPWPAYP